MPTSRQQLHLVSFMMFLILLGGRLFLPDGLNTTRLRAGVQHPEQWLIAMSQKDEKLMESGQLEDETSKAPHHFR